MAETELKRFFVGTQLLRQSNQVHLIEYDEDTNTLAKSIYEHGEGEIWSIAASPQNKQQFLTCYNKRKLATYVFHRLKSKLIVPNSLSRSNYH